MLSLTQKLSQKQILSPQQIQYQKLLQLNTLALEQRIKTELELNPMLEEEMDLKELEPDEKESAGDDADDAGDDTVASDDEFGVEDYMNDEDYSGDETYFQEKQSEEDRVQPLAAARESLSEHLLNQLYLLDLDDRLIRFAEEIIGNLDEDGYLKADIEQIRGDMEMFDHVAVSAAEAEAVLHEVQSFDPIGIASRNLQECLLIQIQHGSFDHYYSYLAEELLKNHYQDFVQKRFDQLMHKLDLTEETLRSVLDLIHRLNPKPGEGSIDSAELNQITPDFLVEKSGEDYVITLNDRSLPSITINRTYLEMVNENKGKKKLNPHEKNAYKFLREKFESAKWFIACIEQRRETLMKVMRAIVEKQYEFFDAGAKHLRPMIYKDIAEEISMDISTIARVVNGKFVQSPQGIHELKFFFSEGLATDSGEEVSNKHVKEIIRDQIEKEDKRQPLSDDALAEILNEQGIHIARRTVAKYREQMRIPVARLRKTL